MNWKRKLAVAFLAAVAMVNASEAAEARNQGEHVIAALCLLMTVVCIFGALEHLEEKS